MTLEQIIRYAVTGILAQRGETMNDEIQYLIDILIDFGSITDKELTDILNQC